MQHNHPQHSANRLAQFMPLILILSVIIGLTAATQWNNTPSIHSAMNYFMGFFFIIFGGFKLINWHAFVESYSMYDLIAQKSTLYAYAYPLIEISLGIAYLAQWHLPITNIITLIIMSISALGVAKELMAGRKITCACLGVVFKIPMTWVTFFEDFLMASMALAMLITR